MRAEFNKLVETMQKYDLYQAFDEVDIALIDLHDKITEVEKRIECAIRSNIDSQEIVNLFINGFQDEGKLKQKLHYGDFETLQRGVYDVAIALDLKDTEPIDNNWYDLFGEPKKTPEVSNGGIPYQHCYHCSIKEEETVMSKVNNFWLCSDCNEETNEVFMTFISSKWGEINCDKDGNVISIENDHYCNIAKINLKEYAEFCSDNNITHGECNSIDMVGYWEKNHVYRYPNEELRLKFFKGTDIIPTSKCSDSDTMKKVNEVINTLRSIDVDGETMQYILEQVGMTDQMLRQLVMTKKSKKTKKLLREKKELQLC